MQPILQAQIRDQDVIINVDQAVLQWLLQNDPNRQLLYLFKVAENNLYQSGWIQQWLQAELDSLLIINRIWTEACRLFGLPEPLPMLAQGSVSTPKAINQFGRRKKTLAITPHDKTAAGTQDDIFDRREQTGNTPMSQAATPPIRQTPAKDATAPIPQDLFNTPAVKSKNKSYPSTTPEQEAKQPSPASSSKQQRSPFGAIQQGKAAPAHTAEESLDTPAVKSMDKENSPHKPKPRSRPKEQGKLPSAPVLDEEQAPPRQHSQPGKAAAAGKAKSGGAGKAGFFQYPPVKHYKPVVEQPYPQLAVNITKRLWPEDSIQARLASRHSPWMQCRTIKPYLTVNDAVARVPRQTVSASAYDRQLTAARNGNAQAAKEWHENATGERARLNLLHMTAASLDPSQANDMDNIKAGRERTNIAMEAFENAVREVCKPAKRGPVVFGQEHELAQFCYQVKNTEHDGGIILSDDKIIIELYFENNPEERMAIVIPGNTGSMPTASYRDFMTDLTKETIHRLKVKSQQAKAKPEAAFQTPKKAAASKSHKKSARGKVLLLEDSPGTAITKLHGANVEITHHESAEVDIKPKPTAIEVYYISNSGCSLREVTFEKAPSKIADAGAAAAAPDEDAAPGPTPSNVKKSLFG